MADIEKRPYDFAEFYFYGFLATSSLWDLSGRSGVQFAGLPRVGKSSAVAVQCGSRLSQASSPDGSTTYTTKSKKGDPKMSSSLIAKTINVTMYRDNKYKRNIVDPPGLNDNRSTAYRLWSNFCLETCFALLEGVDATCVMIHYQSSFASGGNADAFQDLASALLASSGDGKLADTFMDNLCFCFTHVSPVATVPGILQRLKEVHASFLVQLVNVLEGLAERFPRKQDVSEKAKDISRFIHHSHSQIVQTIKSNVKEHRIRTDFENPKLQKDKKSFSTRAMKLKSKIEERQGRIDFDDLKLFKDKMMETMERLDSSVRLLEFIIKNPLRIVLSRPNGARECKTQRKSLEAAFRRCDHLDRSTLRELAGCRRLPTYMVYEILEHVSRKMCIKLDPFNKAMGVFITSVEEQDVIINSIGRDWRAAKSKFIARHESKKKAAEREIKDIRKENNRMKYSKELKTPPGNILSASKMRTGFWSWLGVSRTMCSVSYNGLYEDISVAGDFDDYEICEKEDKNGATVTVRSKQWESVNAQVHFRRFECDLNETKEKILENGHAIKRLQLEVNHMEETLLSLASVDSPESLTNIVVIKKMKTEVKVLSDVFESLTNKVPTGICDDDGKLEGSGLQVDLRSVCFGLHKLLSALTEKSAIPSVIENSSWRETIDKFLISYSKYETLVAKYKSIPSAGKIAEMVSFNLSVEESAEKIDVQNDDDRYDVIRKHIVESMGSLRSVAHPKIIVVVRDHPIPVLVSIGIALMAHGIQACFWTTVGIFLIFLGTSVFVSQALHTFRHMITIEIESMKKEVESRIDTLETAIIDHGGAELKRQIDETRSSLLDVLQDRIEKTDSRLKPKEILIIAAKGAFALLGLAL